MAYLPPYRDPELRRAFALSPDEQRALLMQMAGETGEATAVRKRGTFTPHVLDVRRTAKSLVVLAAPFPESVITPEDSRQLTVIVEHAAFSTHGWTVRHQPRNPEAVADLQAALDECAPLMGTWRLPFASPRTWTRSTVRRLFDVLASYLPDGEMVSSAYWHEHGIHDHKCIAIGVSGTDRRIKGGWRSLRSRPFSVEVRLPVSAEATALKKWREVFNANTGGTLQQIDEILAQRPEAGPSKSTRPKRRLYDEDDKDLDFIERAARKALHSDSEPDIDDEIDEAESIAEQIEDTAARLAALRKRIEDLRDN